MVIATTHAHGNLLLAVLPLCLTGFFILVMLLVIRPLMTWHIPWKQTRVSLSLILLLLSAYTTNAIGIHPIFGAFLMGLILPRKPVFLKHIQSLDQVNMLLFLPLFFVSSGLRTQMELIHAPVS